MTNPSQMPYPQGQHPHQPEPNGQPKSKTGLIVGIVVAILVIGGIIALIITLTSKDDPKPAAAPSTGQSATRSATSSSSAANPSSTGKPTSASSSNGSSGGSPLGIGKATPDELMSAYISTYNSGDMKGYAATHCSGVSNLQAGGRLQQNGSPEITGDSGTAKITITSPSGENFPGILSLENSQGMYWCVAKESAG